MASAASGVSSARFSESSDFMASGPRWRRFHTGGNRQAASLGTTDANSSLGSRRGVGSCSLNAGLVFMTGKVVDADGRTARPLGMPSTIGITASAGGVRLSDTFGSRLTWILSGVRGATLQNVSIAILKPFAGVERRKRRRV